MMDDSMLLPLDVREEAFMMEANLPDVVMSMQESGNYPGLDEEQLTKRAIRDINSTLRESQCYVCLFANKKRVAFFWLTPTIAQRYLSLRDALTQLNERAKQTTGQEITEVATAPIYSHGTPLHGAQQAVLVPRFADKVHAFWIKAGDLHWRMNGNSTRQIFKFEEADRPDLRWYPVPMDDSNVLDEVYSYLKEEGMFVNVEPYEMPPPVMPFPPNATNVTAAQRQERQQQHWASVNAQAAVRQAIRNPPEHQVVGGLLEITVTATGLVCNRMDYAQVKTPVLTWKQIRKAIPKSQRKRQREPGQPLAIKRRRVIVQRKE